MNKNNKQSDNVINYNEHRKRRRQEQTLKSRKCNLCGDTFVPQSRFERFCRRCRENDERYLFSEWLNDSSY